MGSAAAGRWGGVSVDRHALHLPDGGVAESAQACGEFYLVIVRAKELGLREALGSAGRAMFDILEQAGSSSVQRAQKAPFRRESDGPTAGARRSSSLHDPITTRQAAELLGQSRQAASGLARRLAPHGAAERDPLTDQWLLERADVVAHAADRGVTRADRGEDSDR